MAVTMVRASILYIVVIFIIRLMGKRQIGELQPSELVITILISEIVSIPMQDNTIPILNSLVAVFVLVSFEIIVSVINLKSEKIRGVFQGHPVIVIRNGTVDMKALGKLRMTLNDLLGALRQKDIFEISKVSYAIFETNGQISVLLKPPYKAASAEDINLSPADNGMPFAVVCDGKIIENALKESGKDEKFIRDTVNSQNIAMKNIMIMTVDNSGAVQIIRKDNEK